MPAVSSAALYGRGVFSTIAIYGGKPFLWNLHEKRLKEHAAKISLDASEINFASLQNSLLEIAAANKIETGRARITLFDANASSIWQFQSERKTAILITTAKPRNYAENELNLTVSPFCVNSNSPLAGVKSCNYLENLLTLETTKMHGFDEALRLNERGEIVSAVMANIFWIKNEMIFTPSLQTGALAGTTREFVIGLARKSNLEILETNNSIADLQMADEIFLTSAGKGICAARSLDGKKFQNEITQKLQQLFFEFINK